MMMGIGGERRNLVQFELEWHQDPIQTAAAIRNHEALPCGRVENPRLVRTVDGVPTDFPSRRETRPHMPHTPAEASLFNDLILILVLES